MLSASGAEGVYLTAYLDCKYDDGRKVPPPTTIVTACATGRLALPTKVSLYRQPVDYLRAVGNSGSLVVTLWLAFQLPILYRNQEMGQRLPTS